MISKEAKQQYDRLRYQRNPEPARQRAKLRARVNPLENRARAAQWQKDHPAEYSQRQRDWREANTGYLQVYRRSRHAEQLAHNQARRARKRGSAKEQTSEGRALSAAFYRKVKSAKQMRCHWCGRALKSNERHVDHIIPLVKGGAHALFNLCCSCPTCILKKSAKLPQEFSGQFEISFNW